MANPWIILPNVQSIPVNPLLQLHDPSVSQVPAFLQASASHANAGHVPSLSNATSPGQGVAEVIGLPLNIYRNYYQLCIHTITLPDWTLEKWTISSGTCLSF